jgi:hypothetical protein
MSVLTRSYPPPEIWWCESRFYAAAPSLTVVTIPGTGHDLALSTTAPSRTQ